VPKLRRTPGAIGLALTAYDLWRRLPPEHRRLVMTNAKRYGPAIAAAAVRSARTAATRRNRP
jgi:hypothetical protein